MKKFLQKIDNIMSWNPLNAIDLEVSFEWIEYDEPRVEGSLFYTTTETGFMSTNKVYTKFGNFILDLPAIPSCILFLLYIIVSFVIYIPFKALWIVIRGFLPSKWFLDFIEQNKRKLKIMAEKDWLYYIGEYDKKKVKEAIDKMEG